MTVQRSDDQTPTLMTSSCVNEGGANEGGQTPQVSSSLNRPGRMRPMILLWALGVPIPLILIIMLIRGCTG